ncbi:MAG: AMP-binding protein [Candidatus Gracilibacteria bacterium]
MKIINILTLWKKEFSKNKNENFLWDNILGMQSKKDFIIKAYLIADYIKTIKGDYVGVMLPAVGSASLLIIATYLAGKTPVMFNWTLGKESFKHCKDFSKVEFILTSSNFYDKVKNDFLEEYNKSNTFVYLEDLLRNISLGKKIKTLIKSKLMIIPKLQKNGVILFTSGSESLPKAVPLTHTNLIENIKGSLNIFEIKTDDILLGFLPPFHSFGFTINTIMPLITGLKVVYTPDPNDAKTILEIIKHTKVTTITSTPTFLKMIMALAKGEDLKNIRYVVVGAEKCPKEVFDKFKELSQNGVILEGYGITECSPVLSINPIILSKPGTVGKIIPNLDCKILSLENMQELKVGEQGMIYVSGSSIFNGYLDEKLENPFEEINGKQYYKTGDLGLIDQDGYLSITGRLKRFIKIAGEMISLPFVEGILLEKYGSEEELKVAIEAIEKDGNAKIVLFSIEHIEVDEVNDYLRKRGVSNLVKIAETIIIEKIPVLGTGKTDYKSLKSLIII